MKVNQIGLSEYIKSEQSKSKQEKGPLSQRYSFEQRQFAHYIVQLIVSDPNFVKINLNEDDVWEYLEIKLRSHIHLRKPIFLRPFFKDKILKDWIYLGLNATVIHKLNRKLTWNTPSTGPYANSRKLLLSICSMKATFQFNCLEDWLELFKFESKMAPTERQTVKQRISSLKSLLIRSPQTIPNFNFEDLCKTVPGLSYTEGKNSLTYKPGK